MPPNVAELPRDADLRGLRLGVPREYFPGEGLQPGVCVGIAGWKTYASPDWIEAPIDLLQSTSKQEAAL